MAATVSKPSYYFSWPRPTSLVLPVPGILNAQRRRTRRTQLAICFVLEETSRENPVASVAEEDPKDIYAVVPERLARKKPERATYLGITSIVAMAVYFQFELGREVPLSEILGPFASSIGAVVGMEFWARWAHKYLWHASFCHMHESHHKPRESPFELNDMIAVINALPAIGLISYGNSNKGLIPGFCYATGLGITVFGIAYVFVHDGLIHNRFPAGPIANVPYFRKVAAAHQLHHSEKFDGVPYGLFLGPKELEEVGGLEELEKEIERRKKFILTNVSQFLYWRKNIK